MPRISCNSPYSAAARLSSSSFSTRGVDVNKPSPIAPLIFVTPLCAARTKRRSKIEALLLRRGAQEDIFTHAFLGDLDRLREVVGHDPGTAQAIDPAVDALQITPVHHAVAGGQMEALRALLSTVSQTNAPLRGASRAIREAVARENVAMVAMLLEHGASADVGRRRAVGSCTLSWRRCSRAPGRASSVRARGSGSRAPGTKDERMIRFMSPRCCVTARVSRTSASPGRAATVGEPRHCITPPRQAS